MPFSSVSSPILVTGATGHTGRRVVRRLLRDGAWVRALVRTEGNASRLGSDDRLGILLGSADNEADMERAARGCGVIIHLAHMRYIPTLLHVLDRHRGHPVRLVALSSTRALSRYASPVREEVRDAEEALRQAGEHVGWTVLRSSMIFGGADDNNLERLAVAVRRCRVFPLFGDGRNLVQPNFVEDLVEGLVGALERPETAGRIYDVAGPEAMTYREMVRQVARAAGLREPIFLSLPRSPGLLAARVLKRIWRKSPVDPEMIRRFGEDKAFDISAARAELGYSPTPFAEALERKFARSV